MLVTYIRPMRNNNLGGVVQSWVKITQGYSAKFEFRFESIKSPTSTITNEAGALRYLWKPLVLDGILSH